MDIQKIGVKFFAEPQSSIEQSAFIPVFHSWIQQKAVEGHLLIDIHDYSHVPNGPGILLVSHEANIAMDEEDGLGLLYVRKQPQEGDLAARISGILKTARDACARLESDDSLSGLKFKTDSFLFFVNDRLASADCEETVSEISAAVKQAVGDSASVARKEDSDPRERLTLVVTVG